MKFDMLCRADLVDTAAIASFLAIASNRFEAGGDSTKAEMVNQELELVQGSIQLSSSQNP